MQQFFFFPSVFSLKRAWDTETCMVVGNLAVHACTVRDAAGMYGAAYTVGQQSKESGEVATLVGLRRNERIREDAIALITAFDQKAIRIPEPRRMKLQ
jgi:hypothetical protein